MAEYVFDFDRFEEPDLTTGMREAVVRCRDCKYYADGTVNGRRYSEPHCNAVGELSHGALFEVDENDFCSWGERRDAR